MMQAACYDIYSRDAAALAACLAYLCEVEQFALPSAEGLAGQGLNFQPMVRIWPQQNVSRVAQGPSGEAADTLIWEVENPAALQQLGQRAAFYQYRQQQEGTAAAILQSHAMQYHGHFAWQILDLDGRCWIFRARKDA